MCHCISLIILMNAVNKTCFQCNCCIYTIDFLIAFFFVCFYIVIQRVLSNGVDYELIETTMIQLRTQHKVLSKQVLQNILEQRSACNIEFAAINETQKELEESLWTCRKARSYLNYAKQNLTTTSLEILASYRKREILKELLNTLQAIKKLVSINYIVLKGKHTLYNCLEYPSVWAINLKLGYVLNYVVLCLIDTK